MCHFLAPVGQPEMMHKNFMRRYLRISVARCSGMKFLCPFSAEYTISTNFDYQNGHLTRLSRGGYDLNTSTTEKKTQNYNFTYDGFGNQTEIAVGNHWLTRNAYAPKNGQLQQQTYANGDATNYTYDNLNRTIKTTTSSGDVYTYAYTGDGQLGRMTDKLGNTNYQYTYDSLGRLIRTSRAGAQTLQGQYSFDENNRITKIAYGIPGVVDNSFASYYYNNTESDTLPAGVLTKMSLFSAEWMHYSYDSLGRMSARNIASTLNENYSYLPSTISGYTTTIISGKQLTDKSGTVLHNYTYTYDKLGNIASTHDAVGNRTVNYTYDIQGQLLTAEEGSQHYSYTYDTYGNIRSKTDEIVGIFQQSRMEFTYGDEDWLDLLTGVTIHRDGETTVSGTITYDASGNPLQYFNGSQYAMTWRNGKELNTLTTGGKTTRYEYDVDGLRTKKVNPDGSYSDYYWLGKLLLAEQRYDSAGNRAYTLQFSYDENDSPIGVAIKAATAAKFTYYYFGKNIQGDIVDLYRWNWSESGNHTVTKVATYTYDPWGQLLDVRNANGVVITSASDPALVNPIRYRGYYYDGESGFYYLQARYYDPQISRFINADDYSDTNDGYLGYNMFTYCLNNPINRADSTGDWSLSNLAKIAIGVAVIAAAAAVVVATGGAAAGPVVAAVHCAATGALQGAIIGAATGAASGAVSGAIQHRIQTGSWKGAGQAAVDGACDGFMTGAITGAIEGAMTSPYCFIAGTVVLIEAGKAAIETIAAGNKVWAWDEETGDVSLKEVVETYINETDELVHVWVKGEEIVATPSHPFYSPVKGWTDAVQLRAGDILVLVNGEYVVVEKVQHELLESPIKVYNFQVADYHTYYVSDAGVLVHNTCKDYSTKNTVNESSYVNSEREARALARTKVGHNPLQVEPGKLRSANGVWQYRAKPDDLLLRHIHLKRLNPTTGEVLYNLHIRW